MMKRKVMSGVEASLFMSVPLDGNWKYYRGYRSIGDKPFNLKDDSMEKSNLIEKHPKQAKRLMHPPQPRPAGAQDAGVRKAIP